MTTFYYVAVSASARLKMAGKIESASEKDARTELNKMGLAVLSLTTEKPVEFKSNTVATDTLFEFVAQDKFAKVVNGTIDAIDKEEAYDRLVTEFHFNVQAIYPEHISPEEKEKALKEGIKAILELKSERKIEEDSMKKRTLRGGLASLVQFAGGKDEEADENLKNAIEIDGQVVDETQDVVAKAGHDTGSASQTQTEESSMGDEVKTIISKRESLEERILHSKNVFNKVYFFLTELIIPSKGKNRKEVWKEISENFSLSEKLDPKNAKNIFATILFFILEPMGRKALLQKVWILAESVCSVLAFIYFSYFLLANLAVRYGWVSTSGTLVKAVQDSTMVPFLAFTFVFLRLLIWLREKFTSWSPLRTALLFTSGGVFLAFLSLNLLY